MSPRDRPGVAPAPWTPGLSESTASPVARLLRRVFWGGVLALAAVAATVAGMYVAEVTTERWVTEARESARMARRAERLAVDQETAVRGYLLTRDSVFLARARASRAVLPPLLDSLDRAAAGDSLTRTQLVAIRQALGAWEGEFVVPALAAGGAPATARRLGELAGKPLFDRVRASFDALVRREDARYAARSRRDRLLRIAGAAAVAAELTALALVLVWLRRRVANQASRLLAKQEQLEQQAVELELQTAELAEANDALAQAEEQYRRLVESAPYGVMVYAEDRIVFANAMAGRILGAASGEDLLGRDALDFVHPDDRPTVRERTRLNLDAAAMPLTEVKLLRLDGAIVEAESVGIPFTYEGRPAVQVVFRDVTARKRLEAQYRQAQKMEAIGQLAGGVAHDFNNLLTVMTTYSGMLLAELPADAPVRGDVEEIRRAAARAAALTRQLLAFSRQQVLEPRVLDVNAVLREMEKMLRRVLREDVRLRLALAPELGRVYADPGQIEQVVVNLVVNARDAMPTGGTLTIETADVELDDAYARTHADVAPGPYVMLAVADTGVGMDAETQARMFEPFFTTKPVGHGTGLGLATVYGIVKQSGGHVWVYSEPGRGTTFKVYLPRVSAPATPRPRPGHSPLLHRGSETILLAEDDDAVRAATCRILERAGYRVLTAADGPEALRAIETAGAEIDLLLTDLVMPESSGADLAAAARRRRPGLPVLFMSGYTDDAVLRQSLVEPGAHFVQKPFTPEALTRKVREAITEGGAGA